jgi:hypothetical protein
MIHAFVSGQFAARVRFAVNLRSWKSRRKGRPGDALPSFFFSPRFAKSHVGSLNKTAGGEHSVKLRLAPVALNMLLHQCPRGGGVETCTPIGSDAWKRTETIPRMNEGEREREGEREGGRERERERERRKKEKKEKRKERDRVRDRETESRERFKLECHAYHAHTNPTSRHAHIQAYFEMRVYNHGNAATTTAGTQPQPHHPHL